MRSTEASVLFLYGRRRGLGAAVTDASALAVFVLGSLFAAATSRAAESDVSTAKLEEVTVTAQKVSEDVQKVPISMTVLTAADLAQQGVHEFQEVLSEIPNLAYQYGLAGASGMGMSSARGISIRGISGFDTTSLYIDDTPVPVYLDPRILDIERIETLKGPQGTLYGQASMGGTIRIITMTPSSGSFGGTVDVDGHNLEGGGFGSFDRVSVNVPVAPDTALRVGGYFSYDPGFLTRTYDDPGAINGKYVTGPPVTVNHVGSVTSYGEAISLLFAPENSSGLEIEPKFIAERTIGNGFLATDYTTTDYVQRRALNVPEGWSTTDYLAATTVRLDTGIGKLVSATSVFYGDSADREDGSDVNAQLFNLVPVIPIAAYTDLYSEQFTQEIRLNSEIGSSINTTAGVYFNDTLTTYDEDQPAPGAIAAGHGTINVDNAYDSHQPGRTTEKSVFASATYKLTDDLSLTAGIRRSYFTQQQAATTYGFANGGFSQSNLSTTSNAVTPRFAAEYQITDNNMAYATAAKGFRPGGTYQLPDICAADLANIGLKPGQLTFQSDSLWNYELGSKNRWLDGRLVANVDVYDMEWKNIQQVVRLPICGFDAEVNGAAARSKGSEVEISALPLTGLTVGVSAGYEDAAITAISALGSGNLYVGQPLNGVPKYTGSANLEYEHDINALGHAFIRVDYQYVGSSLSLNNSPVLGRVRPSYVLLDLRIGTTLRNNLEVTLYGKNLTDSHPNLGDEVSEIVETIGRPRYVVGPPTAIGVEVQKKF